MPHVTFIFPCVGRFPDTDYVRSWQMEPLCIGILAKLTPPSWGTRFFDDRLEEIDYSLPTDLVAISIETYSARRGYQIANRYRQRGIPVVFGGYHATFCPEEALSHGDAVCVGEAEGVWADILNDTETNRLAGVYTEPMPGVLKDITPDRSIFRGKRYFKLALVETGRGCCFNCNFCSVTAFHQGTYRRRPIDEIVNEIRSLKVKRIFFVDDNIVGELQSAKTLFEALKPLKIEWISQGSINVARDRELLDAMRESGCTGLLVGFESLSRTGLQRMGKSVNTTMNYANAIKAFHEAGIVLYGSFVFGLNDEGPDEFSEAVRFAREQKLFLAAFAHLIPFPGTPLYHLAESEGLLDFDKWWLSDTFRFGQTPFHPRGMSSRELEERCNSARKEFYSLGSIFSRSLNLSANCQSLQHLKLYFVFNMLLRREIGQKRGLPLGLQLTGEVNEKNANEQFTDNTCDAYG